jgi:hypothetical protein
LDAGQFRSVLLIGLPEAVERRVVNEQGSYNVLNGYTQGQPELRGSRTRADLKVSKDTLDGKWTNMQRISDPVCAFRQPPFCALLADS